jgi:organic hydroperoxide reductase OsmC/OhrA
MRDLAIRLEHRPGALAELGAALGKAGVNIEGGGGFVVGGQAIVHFLFEDGARARAALEAAGIQVLEDREVIAARLDQGQPGQLGRIARQLADAGVNLEVVYSDHDHQLILGVGDLARGREVCAAWSSAGSPRAKQHRYGATVRWIGNKGQGTANYRAYGRDHVIEATGKPPLPGSSDPHFRGDAARWNPEELLVASLSACHQLWYLHLCSDAGVVVTAYEDRAEAVMIERPDGSGEFTGAVLRPNVTISATSDPDRARALHAAAHEKCFVANSVRFPVEIQPTITRAAPAP